MKGFSLINTLQDPIKYLTMQKLLLNQKFGNQAVILNSTDNRRLIKYCASASLRKTDLHYLKDTTLFAK